MDNNQPPRLYLLKLRLNYQTDVQLDSLIERINKLPQLAQIDVNRQKKLARLVSHSPLATSDIKPIADSLSIGFEEVSLVPPSQAEQLTQLNVAIDGMTCHSCEVTVERKFKKIHGVRQVQADAAKGTAKLSVEPNCQVDLAVLQNKIQASGYTVRGFIEAGQFFSSTRTERPSFWRLAGLFTAVLLLGAVLTKFSFFKQVGVLDSKVGFISSLVLGLVAGMSSCLAVAGGLLLSSAAKFNEKYGSASALGRLRPVALFILGRVISYSILGGLIALVGNALTPSPLFTAGLMVLAALYMLVMGLDMLHLTPVWLKKMMPKMPKALAHKVMDAEGKEHPLIPALMGAVTFFIPCGFTQALQIYALTASSFWAGALVLGGFALGTAPALLALGWVSSSLKGRVGKLFFQLAGAVVVVLGIFNIQSGFTLAGHPLSLPKFSEVFAQSNTSANAYDPNVFYDGKVQVAKIKVEYAGYAPNRLTLRQGVPTRLIVDGAGAGGCLSSFQIPKFGIRRNLKPDASNVMEFTPAQTGQITFSCGMGMFRGQIKVVAKNS
ncbi:sulfite exporter TauE/SafE family protein [Candidatus Uhrbacteria bacterium]|nr:sulfite exporter TauE/SafE family protein [Candidatus Uhrbacteria bacterium]